ncbi:hypothetical protein Tco_1112340 [Tanacetum coccineum]|uniref:Uncharacterized protein n=1 Tax=Tanacetum coccineum TaxID=301880 RepID=A0ABQ5DQE2_9ASTR
MGGRRGLSESVRTRRGGGERMREERRQVGRGEIGLERRKRRTVSAEYVQDWKARRGERKEDRQQAWGTRTTTERYQRAAFCGLVETGRSERGSSEVGRVATSCRMAKEAGDSGAGRPGELRRVDRVEERRGVGRGRVGMRAVESGSANAAEGCDLEGRAGVAWGWCREKSEGRNIAGRMFRRGREQRLKEWRGEESGQRGDGVVQRGGLAEGGNQGNACRGMNDEINVEGRPDGNRSAIRPRINGKGERRRPYSVVQGDSGVVGGRLRSRRV